ncbi:MAG: outer membrane lipoprotein-sorting protein [Acidobacteria bacterium]|nr:outer membrane lipoprotein-sorting protein [Acidobacteriota bacterium]
MHSRRFFATAAAALLVAAFSLFPAAAQEQSQLRPHPLAPAEADSIVRAFTAKETGFRQALNSYRFKRDATIQTIGLGGQITGEYRRVSNFAFDDQSNRYEKITFMPASTLTELTVTAEDIEDLGGVNHFALELSRLGQYDFAYAGKEMIDEVDTYVFDVTPKVIPKKVSERFFKGRVWVEDKDLQIVKVRGKGVPEGEQRFPTFETYREQVDGKFWFPTYTYADEQLVFKSGQVVHFRMRVRYTDYKRFAGTSKILEEGDIIDDEKKKP